ncbi:hypothetical protein T492DRAFT_837522 [Pavlovales sp. CCMP2436]|nr:hypothetical protein T492DRAFT_837522 [Pavlovales sp. CCMP2436]
MATAQLSIQAASNENGKHNPANHDNNPTSIALPLIYKLANATLALGVKQRRASGDAAAAALVLMLDDDKCASENELRRAESTAASIADERVDEGWRFLLHDEISVNFRRRIGGGAGLFRSGAAPHLLHGGNCQVAWTTLHLVGVPPPLVLGEGGWVFVNLSKIGYFVSGNFIGFSADGLLVWS